MIKRQRGKPEEMIVGDRRVHSTDAV